MWQVGTALAPAQLSDMEREARSIPEPTRRELGNRVRAYKDSLATVKRDLDRAKEKFQRSALMAGSTEDLAFSDDSRAQHQRLIDTNTRLAAGSDRLEGTRRVLAETEDVALGISEQLHRDRQVISGIRDNTAEVGGFMDQARRIVRSMSRRECQQRCLMAFFALFLIAAIIVIVYFVFIKPEEDKKNGHRRMLLHMGGAAARALRGALSG